MNSSKKKRDFTFSRSLVHGALAAYIVTGQSVKNPVQCLDLSMDSEESGKWINAYGSSVNVIESKLQYSSPAESDSNVLRSIESSYALIEKTDFNFIYVECTTEGSSYFDCVFRKIARNGVFALSTSDDPALYGRPAEPALRCYGGLISRTFYAPELAVRLVAAAMARSAARFSKSIEVLLAVTVKNAITIIVKVKKGADSAIKCLKKIKLLAHCSVCEERCFLPDNDGYILSREEVQSYLSCDCNSHSVGRTVLGLGPLWADAIGSPSFVALLLPHLSHSLHLTTFLQDLLSELGCSSCNSVKEDILSNKNSNAENQEQKKEDIKETVNKNFIQSNNSLKRKTETDLCDLKNKINKCENNGSEPAPQFYYNLHKHKPKGAQKLLKVEKIIESLHQSGFRASRTHFDRAAVKTDATLKQLHSVLSQVI
ncbi:TRMT1-like protein isoform X1 [Homalodisca vitripennis]|uniref:TRMT1-like protein isoform X1 n=2 Tax=Homalodisca vitripennis TaxID=197043 RepID=UPI001EEC5635|nr:TRMT1-like protein isoform X1 [Homalodisca vitripennis]